MTRSVLALVNGQPWDMHKPLTEDCELRFLHFKDEDPSLSNKVYTSSHVCLRFVWHANYYTDYNDCSSLIK